MNKKGIILLAVLMIVGGAAFASGQQDMNEDGVVVVDGRNQMDREEITLTGQVDFTSRGTKLTVSGEEWTLRYPMHLVDMDIEDGSRITVSGWEFASSDETFGRRGPQFNLDENEKALHVTSAVIDGVTYELDFDRGFEDGGRMGRSGQGGRMGSYNNDDHMGWNREDGQDGNYQGRRMPQGDGNRR